MNAVKNNKNNDEAVKLQKQVSLLKMQLEETSQLAAAKERVLKANLSEIEKLYGELTKKLKEVRTKGYEIRVLNALNAIIATASRYISINEILQPTLGIIISSVETLLAAGGRTVKITGGIFLFDADKRFLVLSALQGISPESLGCGGTVQIGECLCGLAGISREMIFSQSCLSDPRHTKKQAEHLTEEHAHVNIPLKSGDDMVGIVFLYIQPPGYEPTKADMAVFASIGSYIGLHIEKARLYALVENLAIHDGLTGLLNRREFDRLLEVEIDRAGRYSKLTSLLMLDIDHFKKCNDIYGHQFGDDVLREVGLIIRKLIRTSDVPARYGGEEMTVIMPETDIESATVIAERLRATVEKHPFYTGEETIHLTISIGAASFPLDAKTPSQLVHAADKALYYAKENGRNRVCRIER